MILSLTLSLSGQKIGEMSDEDVSLFSAYIREDVGLSSEFIYAPARWLLPSCSLSVPFFAA